MKKSLFLLLSCIVLSFSLNARELTRSERQAISALPQAKAVLEFMAQEIDTSLMSWHERMTFRTYQAACLPIDLTLAWIANEDDLEDQTGYLQLAMPVCLTGVVQVTDTYRRQRQ